MKIYTPCVHHFVSLAFVLQAENADKTKDCIESLLKDMLLQYVWSTYSPKEVRLTSAST